MEIISVAKASCLPVWKTASEKIVKWIPADHYRVIVPESDTRKFQEASHHRFEIESEVHKANHLLDALREAMPAQNAGRLGWYFQQLIKLEYVRRAADAGRDAVIWDADTIPLGPIEPFDSRQVKFFPGSEYHLPYFRAIEIALGLDKIVLPSFVAQSFPVRAAWATSFFEELEKRHSLPWWAALINSTDLARKSGFSEYETLGTFVSHNFPEQMQWDLRRWTRRGYEVFGQPNEVREAQTRKDFVFAAFEQSDRAKATAVSPAPKKKLHSLRSFALRISRRFSTKRFIKNLLVERKEKPPLHILQIGNSNGHSLQFGLTRLGRKGLVKIEIFEPRPHHTDKLSRLAPDQDFCTVKTLIPGERDGNRPIYWLRKKWAGQISINSRDALNSRNFVTFLKAPLIWWWTKNSHDLKKHELSLNAVKTEIGALKVKVRRTSTLLTSNPEDSFLLFDVSGIEMEVLKGLEPDCLPRWVAIFRNSRDRRALLMLRELGYEIQTKGSRLVLERKD